MNNQQPAPFHYQRDLPIRENYDLVVSGGGPAGAAAAIAAARLGLRVLLCEGMGCLGGMGTSALVSAWSDLADGRHMIVGGLFKEILEKMYARGGFRPNVDPASWQKHLHGGVGFKAEVLKILLDELCQEAGVTVRFFTRVVDAEAHGQAGHQHLEGVILQDISGHQFVPARAFVDATGDAVLAKISGAPCREAGKDTPHIMPPTLCASLTGIDFDRFRGPIFKEALAKALSEGYFSQPDRHVPGIFRNGEHTAILNAGHVFGMDALNPQSLSEGLRRGRQLAKEYTGFFKKYARGCEHIEMIGTAALMGVRESRRIAGEYELNYEDFKSRRQFPDQIAVYNKSVDIHVYNCSDEEYHRYEKEFTETDRPAAGEIYGIPYGILVPRGWDNLWVAGRCASSDIKVHGAIRDQPACFMMGEAAGTAAAQCLRTGQTAQSLDTETLVKTLRERGGFLPQQELSKEMTRQP